MAAVLPFPGRAPREDDFRVPERGMVVDIGGPMSVNSDGFRTTELAGGDIEVDFNPSQQGALDMAGRVDADQHDANLADYVDETTMDGIAQDLCEGVDADLASRREWYERLGKGMELLGITEPDKDLGVFKIAKKITHPIIAEAAVQFQARAIAELFPPGGPAKTMVLGKRTREREDQAERVKDYLNYQLVFVDRPYFSETDQMLFMLGLEGSEFRKVYHDPILKRSIARWVRCEDFVVHYSATSLETAPRYTHVLHETHNDVLKKQASGFYRQDFEVPLPTVVMGPSEQQPLRDAKADAEGNDLSHVRPEDSLHDNYEVHCELNLPGFEDLDEMGQPTGIALPYVVYIHRDTQKVLAIYRNWREPDQLREKRIWFTHYKYLPGTGFYGFGLLHFLGGLGAAATGVLRTIMVSAAFAGAGGGFKTREGGKVSGPMELTPGVFKDTEAGWDELKKAFFQPEFKQPPEALFSVLGHLVDNGRRFASTTETSVGDAKNTGPVGTTIALIEQGQKIFSGIHKRCHIALGVELQMLAECNGEHLTEEPYPYDLPGETKYIMRRDFDKRVDVMPISDPNISSNTQRIAISQTCVDMADKAPDIWDRREAHRRFAEALRVPDVDSIIIDKKKIGRADPVSENALAITGNAIRVYEDQDHDAHNAVHMAMLRDSNVPDQAKAGMAAHIAEHTAQKFRIVMSQAMGIAPVPVDFDADPGQPMAQQLPPEVENQIAQRAAAAINKVAPPPQDPKVVQVEGELKLKQQKVMGELKLKGAEANHRMALERKVAFGKLSLEREIAIRRMQQEGQKDQAQTEQDRLNGERDGIDGEVKRAVEDVQQAVLELAQGLAQIVGQAGSGAPAGAQA